MTISRLLLNPILILILFAPFWPSGVAQAQKSEQPFPGTSSVTLEAVVQSPDYLSCGNEIVPIINQEYEQEVVELVNQERANLGIPPLKRVDLLDQAARYHSADLGQDDYFDHDSYDRIGEELNFICIWWARIQTFYPNVRAENIAAGYQTPSSVVQAWMESPGHRQNILSSYSDEIGVGYFEGEGQYNKYWTQDFGDRSNVYPVVINGEAAETEDRTVSLYIYGEWNEMRLRNNDEEWTAWQPFQNTLDWQLPAVSAEHVVSVEMRDLDASTISSDSIYLSAQPTEPVLGNLPTAITFTYSVPIEQFLPEFAQQTPLNVGSSDPLNWEITTQSTWFTITPTAGTTPDVFKIIPKAIVTPTLITTTGIITISASSLMGKGCTPHVMNVSIQLIDDAFKYIFIPMLNN